MAVQESRRDRRVSLALFLRNLGFAVVGLAFVVPATTAFAADVTPPAAPAVTTPSGAPVQPGLDLSTGTLQLLGTAPAATDPVRVGSVDGGPAVVLRSSVSRVSTPAVPGIPDPTTSGYAAPVRGTDAVPVSVVRSATGSRAPPAGR